MARAERYAVERLLNARAPRIPSTPAEAFTSIRNTKAIDIIQGIGTLALATEGTRAGENASR